MIRNIIEEMSGTKKSDNEYVDFPASENSSTQIPATNTLIHDGKTYFIHPLYANYAASKDGYIINRKRLKARKGQMMASGYFNLNMNNKKCYTSHRFVYEAVNQLIIPPGMQINHINSNRQDNRSENLELVTPSENMKHNWQYKKIKESNDEFTDEEMTIINRLYNKMTNKIKNGNFPFKKQLQEHFPDVEFW